MWPPRETNNEHLQVLQERHGASITKGPLSAFVPPDNIRSMNREVEKVIEQSSTEKRERGPYVKFTSSQRALIGKRAAEHSERQLTAVFACLMTGDFLPPQLVYQGKTDHCLPSVEFPNDWSIMCSPNHWSNEQTM